MCDYERVINFRIIIIIIMKSQITHPIAKRPPDQGISFEFCRQAYHATAKTFNHFLLRTRDPILSRFVTITDDRRHIMTNLKIAKLCNAVATFSNNIRAVP